MNIDNTSNILISVIIPVYRVEKYIERCARSLLNQSMVRGIEFIFVDDASPDDSISILQSIINEYPERKNNIKIVSHENNRGLAAARNTGFRNSVGEYIIHCDSDDHMAPDMYEKLLQQAIKEDADVVFCDYVGVYDNKTIIFKQRLSDDPYCTISKILDGTLHNGVWNKLIHRSLYNNIYPLWTEGINMWEDVSIIPRLIYYAKKISYLPAPLYYYNQTNIGAYTKQYSEEYLFQIDRAYTIVLDFYNTTGNHDYDNSLLYFKNRTLFTILARCDRKKRNLWINRYLGNHHVYNSDKFSKINRILYWLYLKNHNITADLITKSIDIIKKITR